MTTIGLCQCLNCERYLARNRAKDGSDPQVCVECRGRDTSVPPGIPLAGIRGTLTDPLSREVLDVLSEENAEVMIECLTTISQACAESIKRNGKIGRWGWEAIHGGTSQQHKLEVELGDVLSAIVLAHHNGQIDLNRVLERADEKMQKFRDDAAGPRERLLVAKVPSASVVGTLLGLIRSKSCCYCGGSRLPCHCENDE